MRGKKTDPTVSASAIAALLMGQGVTEVAEAYNLPESTVRSLVDSKEFAEVRAKKGEDFGDLISQALKSGLEMMKAQTEHGKDKTWLGRQPAAEIAVFYGVVADKAIRILEAAERGNE